VAIFALPAKIIPTSVSPVSATPTPILTPSVSITPLTEATVSQFQSIKGNADNIPQNEHLQLFVGYKSAYFPQGNSITILGNQWSVDAQIGNDTDKGKPFILDVVIIDNNDQEAQRAIDDYYRQQPNYQGIALTKGMHIVASMSVTRSS